MWLQANDDLLINLNNGVQIRFEFYHPSTMEDGDFEARIVHELPTHVPTTLLEGSEEECRKKFRKIKLAIVARYLLLDFTIEKYDDDNTYNDLLDNDDDSYDDDTFDNTYSTETNEDIIDDPYPPYTAEENEADRAAADADLDLPF